MQLTLQVRSYCERPPPDTVQRVFQSFPVILGRSPSCDYFLQDEYISSNHARITLEQGRLLIHDTSQNGVFINGASEPMGRGNSAPLEDGDTIALGDHCLTISIKAASEPTDPFGDFPGAASSETITSVNASNIEANDADWDAPAHDSNNDDIDDTWDLHEPVVGGHGKREETGDSAWAEFTGFQTEKTGQATGPIQTDGQDMSQKPGPQGTISQSGAINQEPPNPAPGGPVSPALNAFARGAGIDPAVLENLDDEQVMQEIGTLAIEAVDCIVLLLKSRNKLKNAIRTHVTTIEKVDNNPLKVLPNGEEALKTLLTKNGTRRFLDTKESISQAVEDLQVHQLAMLDGMKAAVSSILDQFDPDSLENRLEEINPIVANIPITREARLWHLFHEKFEDIREDALDDFSELFEREFRKAYEKGIRARGRTPTY